MKQHSYAFYNGYLSEVYKRRQMLERKLQQLKDVDVRGGSKAASGSSSGNGVSKDRESLRRRMSFQQESSANKAEISSATNAISSGKPLDASQVASYTRIIDWEIEALTKELNGKCSTTDNSYPKNLTVSNYCDYVLLPTLVYELEYPRQETRNWAYILEKSTATFGVIFIMILVSQVYIYPVVMLTVEMRTGSPPSLLHPLGTPALSLQERVQQFPWILSDLLFPFMMEYMLAWYVIWECVLNVFAELTLFADRGFYADWWNSTSWDQYARDWNRPVHNFLLRHVYHSSISSLRVSKQVATLITFMLSALVHELVMWCLFKKARGYLMVMQMMQVPLVMLSKTRFLKNRETLGNVVFWLGIFTGPSFLCSLYLII
jgi:sterol O-acyltransferase